MSASSQFFAIGVHYDVQRCGAGDVVVFEFGLRAALPSLFEGVCADSCLKFRRIDTELGIVWLRNRLTPHNVISAQFRPYTEIEDKRMLTHFCSDLLLYCIAIVISDTSGTIYWVHITLFARERRRICS